jgi:hypothetical protein
MRFSKKLVMLAVLFALCAVVSATALSGVAEAHYYTLTPQGSSARVGEEHNVITSFTHVFTVPELMPVPAGPEMDKFYAKFLYKDGTSTICPAFEPVQFPALTPGDNNCALTSEVIGKEGTVILISAVDDFRMQEGDFKFRYWGFSKQILNAHGDKFSLTATDTDKEYLEIVPMSDLFRAVPGTPIKFKLLFRGEPVAGATIEWADEKAEVFMGDEGPENLATLEAVTDAYGFFEFTPKHSGMNFIAAMHAVEAADPALSMMDFYSGSIIFNVNDINNGSGGCNSGIPAFALLASLFILPVASMRLRRKK